MRGFSLVAAVLLFSGCVSAPTPTAPAGGSGPGANPVLPFHASGRDWLPDPNDGFTAKWNLSFPVNASGFEIAANVKVAAQGAHGGDLPGWFSSAEITLVGPEGEVLDHARHERGPPTTHDLKATAGKPGTYALVLECTLTGGQGEMGLGGDYVEYEIRAG